MGSGQAHRSAVLAGRGGSGADSEAPREPRGLPHGLEQAPVVGSPSPPVHSRSRWPHSLTRGQDSGRKATPEASSWHVREPRPPASLPCRCPRLRPEPCPWRWMARRTAGPLLCPFPHPGHSQQGPQRQDPGWLPVGCTWQTQAPSKVRPYGACRLTAAQTRGPWQPVGVGRAARGGLCWQRCGWGEWPPCWQGRWSSQPHGEAWRVSLRPGEWAFSSS